jgi:hypothetical protein
MRGCAQLRPRTIQSTATQDDGRIRLWALIAEEEGRFLRFLRVVLLPDRETVHNAFSDSSFEP